MSTKPFFTAQWIAMAGDKRGRSGPLLRREFSIPGRVTAATLRISGLGYYQAWINGRRVGDQELHPAQSDYTRRCFYTAHDVTSLLNVGGGVQAVGVMLGDGWYNQDLVWRYGRYGGSSKSYGDPRLLAELVLTTESGTQAALVSDGSWRCAAGPVVESNVYAGETYDARRECPGWNEPGFDDRAWLPAVVADAPGGELLEQVMEPIRAVETLTPRAVYTTARGKTVVDMGQNLAGWARLTIAAPEGTVIRMTFAEAVDACGDIHTASTGVFATGVEQVDTYICRGGGVEVWQPRFTVHGFRYVQVEGFPGVLSPGQVAGVVVHTDLKPAGGFHSSDERLNRLHDMALWTHRSNMHGIPEDCPARERCGWLGDAHIVCDMSMMNFDALRFWEKYLGDIETTSELHGGLPCNIAPGKRTGGTAKPDWMAAAILLPWKLYLWTGRDDLLKRHWPLMTRVMAHFLEKSDGGILDGGYGDWCDPKGSTAPTYTPTAITSTVWFFVCSDIMARCAARLGEAQAAGGYRQQAQDIRRAFIARFYDAAAAGFGSQTANALALNFGLVEPRHEAAVVDSLLRDITDTHGLHHSVGIMGLRYLFEVLSRYGHGAVALALLRQNSYPSFGDLIQRGATTLWEYWGEPEVDAADGPRSLNHPMMAGFDHWFFHSLAGIRLDPEQPGFARVILQPRPPPGLTFVSAWHAVPAGRIESAWRLENGEFTWRIALPAGVAAVARLPFSGTEHLFDADPEGVVREMTDRLPVVGPQ